MAYKYMWNWSRKLMWWCYDPFAIQLLQQHSFLLEQSCKLDSCKVSQQEWLYSKPWLNVTVEASTTKPTLQLEFALTRTPWPSRRAFCLSFWLFFGPHAFSSIDLWSYLNGDLNDPFVCPPLTIEYYVLLLRFWAGDKIWIVHTYLFMHIYIYVYIYIISSLYAWNEIDNLRSQAQSILTSPALSAPNSFALSLSTYILGDGWGT